MMRRRGPRYLMWYDDNPKIALTDKIADAIAAYTRRFAQTPNVVLVNVAVASEPAIGQSAAVDVRGVDFVRQNNFWVGFEKAAAIDVG